MIVAWFREGTSCAGQAIAYEGGVFFIPGGSRLPAEWVRAYGRGGMTTWAYAGLAEWVDGLCPPEAPADPPLARETATPAAHQVVVPPAPQIVAPPSGEVATVPVAETVFAHAADIAPLPVSAPIAASESPVPVLPGVEDEEWEPPADLPAAPTPIPASPDASSPLSETSIPSPPETASEQRVLRSISGVFLTTKDRVAIVSVEEAEGMLTVGDEIVRLGRGGHEDEKVREMEAFVDRLRATMSTEGAMSARLEIEPREGQVAVFLYKQVRARQGLNTRVRQRCTVCHHVTLTSPELQAEARRKDWMSKATAMARGIGLAAVTYNPSPLVYSVSMIATNRRDRGYRCAGCGNKEALESTVYFCPECGAQNPREGNVILKTCVRCRHDFAAIVDMGGFWRVRDERAMPSATSARQLFSFKTDGSVPWGLAFLGDGTRLATGTGNTPIVVTDVGAARRRDATSELLKLPLSYSRTMVMRASGDGSVVAIGHRGGVWLRRTHDGSQLDAITLTKGLHLRTLDHSPTGPRLALVWGKIQIWDYDASVSDLKLEWESPDGPVTGVAFSPDGTLVAACGSDHIRVWRADDGALVREVQSPERPFTSVSWLPDGSAVAAATALMVEVHPVADEACRARLEVDAMINHVAVSCDGRHLAVGCVDKTVRVFDYVSRVEAVRLPCSAPAVVVAFSPRGEVAAAEVGGTVRCWAPPGSD